jgi:hypothetical protein
MERKNINIMKLFSASRNEEEHILNELIYNSWEENPILFLKLLYYTRDSRSGKGDKNTSYIMLKFLKNNFPKTYEMNIQKLSLEYGCIKDLLVMSKYNITDESVKKNTELNILASMLKEDLERDVPTLAVKWAPREKSQYKTQALILSNILFPDCNNSLEKYRKEILSVLNKKINIVEHDMCANNWENIDYSNVPYLSLKKYFCAFYFRDTEKFLKFIKNKKKNKCDINKKNQRELSNKIYDEIYEAYDEILNILNKYQVFYDSEEIKEKNMDLIEYLNFKNKNSEKFILLEKNIEEDDWVIF